VQHIEHPKLCDQGYETRSLYSKPTVNLDVSAVDVARQILDEHADDMCDFLRLRECARRNSLLVPANKDQ
jgi:hypothetical protein